MPCRHCNYNALAMHLPPPNRDRRASGISPPQRMRSYHVKVQSLKEFDSRRWVSSGDPPLGGCFFLKWRITSNDNRRGRRTFSSFARPRQLTSQFFLRHDNQPLRPLQAAPQVGCIWVACAAAWSFCVWSPCASIKLLSVPNAIPHVATATCCLPPAKCFYFFVSGIR